VVTRRNPSLFEVPYNQWTGFYRYPGYLLRQGWLGVDLFFVISGFVISISLFPLYDSGKGYLSPFLIKRGFRICPLHYITCAAFVFLISPSLMFQSGFAKYVVLYALFTISTPGIPG
jgi:peptidoglycan/LPS O-acetylase OafA/YrhL